MDVLVVDDTGMYRYLVEAGAGDGARVQAIDLASAEVDDVEPCVIVAHLPMPDLAFPAALDVWRAQWPDARVVAVSDRTNDAALAALLDAGADAVLPVPVDLDLIGAQIRAVARR